MEERIKCQWPQCSLVSSHEIHFEIERIYVCKAHRTAVQVNIENNGKIWVFKDNAKKSIQNEIIRPGEQKPRHIGSTAPVPVVQTVDTPDWRQEAAKKADAAAKPIDRATQLVKPRKRTRGHDAASRILGDSINRD